MRKIVGGVTADTFFSPNAPVPGSGQLQQDQNELWLVPLVSLGCT